MYEMLFRQSARAEVNWLNRTYGQGFSTELDGWLRTLVEHAERQDWTTSLNAADLVDKILSEDARSFSQIIRRMLDAPMGDRLRALLVILRRRCPPWQFRTATRWILLLDMCYVEMETFYEIDHVQRQVIFASVEIVDQHASDDE